MAETLGSVGKAMGEGDLRRAGRSMGRAATQVPADMLTGVAEAGQATGDIFDPDATERLDEALLPVLKRIFGNGLNYDAIRIKQGRPALGKNPGAVTFPSLIYLGSRTQRAVGGPTVALVPEGITVPLPDNVLVHELVHAWQAQNGGANYLPEAVFGYGVHGEAASYRWWNFTDDNAGRRIDSLARIGKMGDDWRDLPPEPQAQFIQDAYIAGVFTSGDSRSGAYLRYRVRSTAFTDTGDRNSYAAAFGAGVQVEWTRMLRGAVKSLDKGDFRA